MQVRKAAGALGAYISNVDLKDIVTSNNLFAKVRDLVIEHEVVFFRDQNVEPQVFQAFARSFGAVLDHPAYQTVQGADDVQILESTPENLSKIEAWHSDMTFTLEPPNYTLLHGQIIPEYGGDTLWASATTAYKTLSPPMQNFFAGLTAEHDFRHGFKESLAEPGGPERLASAIAANPPVEHPLVCTHPDTGKKALYVNSLFTTRIKELTKLEGDRLLQFLYSHIVSEEHTVRLSWEPQTIAIWDNRSTQHKPVNDFFPQHRKMHRVTICGDKPA